MRKSVRKIVLVVLGVSFAAIVVSGWVGFHLFFPRKGHDRIFVKTYEWSQKSIEVSAYPHLPGYSPGIYYDFTMVGRDGRRRLILTFKNDDPLEINAKTVRFLGEDVAYITVGWKYAVTLDAGDNWKIWDAETELADWQCCYIRIDSADVQSSGNGEMVLTQRGEISHTFRTDDFGQTWNRVVPR